MAGFSKSRDLSATISFLPLPLPPSFLALVPFFARPKLKIWFLGFSLLRNQTEMHACYACYDLTFPLTVQKSISGIFPLQKLPGQITRPVRGLHMPLVWISNHVTLDVLLLYLYFSLSSAPSCDCFSCHGRHKKFLAMRLKLQWKSPIWWPVLSDYVPSSFQEMTEILEDAFFLVVGVFGLFKLKWDRNLYLIAFMLCRLYNLPNLIRFSAY